MLGSIPLLSLAIKELEQSEIITSRHHTKHHNISMMLGLGMILAKHVYWAEYDIQDDDQIFINRALEYLALSENAKYVITQAAVERAHSYTPIK